MSGAIPPLHWPLAWCLIKHTGNLVFTFTSKHIYTQFSVWTRKQVIISFTTNTIMPQIPHTSFYRSLCFESADARSYRQRLRQYIYARRRRVRRLGNKLFATRRRRDAGDAGEGKAYPNSIVYYCVFLLWSSLTHITIIGYDVNHPWLWQLILWSRGLRHVLLQYCSLGG
jgi:hypothetical protein